MGSYLNPGSERFRTSRRSNIYVDKTILFVNACVRDGSRTYELSRRYLEKIESTSLECQDAQACPGTQESPKSQEYPESQEYQIEEIRLSELELKPLDAAALRQRDGDIGAGRLDRQKYRLAYQFAEADEIVIAAPYWDCLFPAVLRLYLEQICVTGIAFAYGEDGALVKLCHAHRLVYITTCGGFLPERSAVESLIRELGRLFSIDDVRFYAAEGLDVHPDRVQEILNGALDAMG